MKSRNIMISLILASLFGGCASYDRIWLYGGYYSGSFRFSAADRDFKTSVVGNPFDAPKAETERAILAAMQGEDKGLRTNFTTTPTTNYKNDRIVMIFNPPGYFAPRNVCAISSGHDGKNSGGTMVLAALYCDGDRLQYGVAASRKALKSPQDPQFTRFVKEIMDFFVPRYSMVDDVPNEGDDDP